MKQRLTLYERDILDRIAASADAIAHAQRLVGELAAHVLLAGSDHERQCVLRWIELGARLPVELFLDDLGVQIDDPLVEASR